MKQTEQLEKKGYVTGSHAKLYGTSAFVTGTIDDEDDFEELSNAYGAGTNRAGGKIGTSKTTSKKKTTTTRKTKNPKTKNPKTKKKKKKKKGKSPWEVFEDNLSKLFDWVEVRLDRLSEKTERWGNLFEKFIDAAGGNAQSAYNAAIKSAKDEQRYTTSASNKYLSEALDVGLEGAKAAGTKKVGKGKNAKTVRNVSDSWVRSIYNKILNDNLDERDIVKYGEKKKGIIDAMQGYIDKAKEAAKSTVELTESINDLIKSQRDAKVEFKKSALSGFVESDNRYGASSKNSALARSNAVSRYAINEFDSAVTSGNSYLGTLGSQAKSAGKLSYKTKKVKVKNGKKTKTVKKKVANNATTKIYESLTGKNKKTYKSYLTQATNCMNDKKIIPQKIIDFFEKFNPSLAGKYEAWNMQVANMEALRQEAADNYAENIKSIMSNISESYANIDEDTENAISLIESRAENMGNADQANAELNKLRSQRANIIANDKAEINTYQSLMTSYAKGMNGGYKGTRFSKASSDIQKKVTAAVEKARGYAKNNRNKIPDDLMMTLYGYYVKGYLSAGFLESCLGYNLAFDSAKQAEAQLEIDEETRKQEALDLYDKKASNISSHYDAEVSSIEAAKNSVSGRYDDTVTQQRIIEQREKEVEDLRKNLADAVKNGEIVENTDPWLERVVDIQEKVNSLNELKLTQFETEIEEKFGRAIQKAEELIDKFDAIKSLIDEEMLYDKDSGKLTDTGWLALGLDSKKLAEQQDNLERLYEEYDSVVAAYENGQRLFGDQTYDEKIRDLSDSIFSVYSDMKSVNDDILSIMEGQAEAELNALQKVIDKRKESLAKKKEYYDWDKNIKGKTKDLQALEQQIRALEGVSGQEAAAKRASLMAQRQEAQEDLDETVKDHIYEMQINGLDDMMDKLNEDLEDWKKEIHTDSEARNKLLEGIREDLAGKGTNYNSSIAGVLNTTSNTTTATEGKVDQLLNNSSETLAKLGEKIDDNAGGNTDTLEPTGNGGNLATGTPANNSTASEAVKAVSGSGNSNKSSSNSGSEKPSSTTKKKQTVTQANAKKAFEYIFNGKTLKWASKEGDNWGKLNKTLWASGRQVYMPKANQIAAWKKLGFNEKDFTTDKLLHALKETGIWPEMKKVQAGKDKHILLKGAELKNVHGYAKGGIIHRSGHYLTDEKGEEIIITKQGILRPLSAGTSIIPADITEKLYAIASNYDMGANARISPVDMSKLQRVGGETISPIINCPITIEGNANEQDVINAINKTLPKISKHVQNDIRKDLRKSGR